MSSGEMPPQIERASGRMGRSRRRTLALSALYVLGMAVWVCVAALTLCYVAPKWPPLVLWSKPWWRFVAMLTLFSFAMSWVGECFKGLWKLSGVWAFGRLLIPKAAMRPKGRHRVKENRGACVLVKRRAACRRDCLRPWFRLVRCSMICATGGASAIQLWVWGESLAIPVLGVRAWCFFAAFFFLLVIVEVAFIGLVCSVMDLLP